MTAKGQSFVHSQACNSFCLPSLLIRDKWTVNLVSVMIVLP